MSRTRRVVESPPPPSPKRRTRAGDPPHSPAQRRRQTRIVSSPEPGEEDEDGGEAGKKELSADEVAELWARFASDHFEMVELLPLELHRNSRLLREMDEESISQRDKLQTKIRDYVAYRLAAVKPGVEALAVEEGKVEDGEATAVGAVATEEVPQDVPPVEVSAEGLAKPEAAAPVVAAAESAAEAQATTPTIETPAELVLDAPDIEVNVPAVRPVVEEATAEGEVVMDTPAEPVAADDEDALGEDEDALGEDDEDAMGEVDEEYSAPLATTTQAPIDDATPSASVEPRPKVELNTPPPATREPTEVSERRAVRHDTAATEALVEAAIAVTPPARYASAVPNVPSPTPAPARGFPIGDIAQLVGELVRNREETLAIAIGAYNTIDRHIRALDSALSAQEKTTLLTGGEEVPIVPAVAPEPVASSSRKRSRKGIKPEIPPPEEGSVPPNLDVDPNEPRYCYCNNVSYGEMVGCDNEDCPYEWFHLACLGLTAAPTGKFLCEACKPGGSVPDRKRRRESGGSRKKKRR